MNKLRITNIQRMCFHDGPGIRTTVFLKGCSIHCPWCSNPENINFEKEGIYGTDYTSEQLYDELIKDRIFWNERDNTGRVGGVTFSGGEPLMQADALCEVFEMLKKDNINIAIESALFVPEDNIKRIIEYVDYVIADIKILQNDVCKKVLGGDVKRYFNNVDYLYNHNKLNLFRIPCCEEYTLTVENQRLILDLLTKYSDIPVQIFKLHGLAEKKYKTLGLEMWRNRDVQKEVLERFYKKIIKNDIKVEIMNT